MTAIDEEASVDGGSPRAPRVVESAAIASRYGRSAGTKRRNRRGYIISGAVATLIVVAWVVWAALGQTGSSIDAEDKGATILNSRSVSISYQVSMPAGKTASCALQVQDETHSIVGWRVVKIPASNLYTTAHTDVVQSAERGVTGLIYVCWLT